MTRGGAGWRTPPSRALQVRGHAPASGPTMRDGPGAGCGGGEVRGPACAVARPPDHKSPIIPFRQWPRSRRPSPPSTRLSRAYRPLRPHTPPPPSLTTRLCSDRTTRHAAHTRDLRCGPDGRCRAASATTPEDWRCHQHHRSMSEGPGHLTKWGKQLRTGTTVGDTHRPPGIKQICALHPQHGRRRSQSRNRSGAKSQQRTGQKSADTIAKNNGMDLVLLKPYAPKRAIRTVPSRQPTATRSASITQSEATRREHATGHDRGPELKSTKKTAPLQQMANSRPEWSSTTSNRQATLGKWTRATASGAYAGPATTSQTRSVLSYDPDTTRCTAAPPPSSPPPTTSTTHTHTTERS